jgi:photosystem II stability/assembly factor-like uncharacterized protein
VRINGGALRNSRPPACHRPRAPQALVAAVGMAVLAAGCASASTKGSGSTSTTGTTTPSPTLVVSPNSGLVGGQQLQVTVSGFPLDATVAVYECDGLPSNLKIGSCGGPGGTTLYTATTGSASGLVIAQPSAGNGQGTTTPCQEHCVMVADVIKLGSVGQPSPTPTATASITFSTTVKPSLADSFLQDLTWVSTSEGWALAAQPCDTGVCARLARTTDGGASWRALPDPPANAGTEFLGCLGGPVCVSGVRFANPEVGYLYGPALLITTDGGQSWQPQPGSQTEALTVADGNVYRVAFDHTGCPGPCDPSLQEAAIGSTTWHTLNAGLAYPGRSGSAEIVDSGSTLLVAFYGDRAGPVSAQATLYRSADAGESWHELTDPCAGRGDPSKEEDLIDLAGAPGGFFAGLCVPRTQGSDFVVVSTDGGVSWQTAGATVPVPGPAVLAAASPATLALSTFLGGGAGRYSTQLLESTDGGRHWATVATDTQPLIEGVQPPAWLGFETPQVGHWIGDPHSIWATSDGGRQWTQTAFR